MTNTVTMGTKMGTTKREGTYKGVKWYRAGTSWYACLPDGVVGPNDKHFVSRAAMQAWINARQEGRK